MLKEEDSIVYLFGLVGNSDSESRIYKFNLSTKKFEKVEPPVGYQAWNFMSCI